MIPAADVRPEAHQARSRASIPTRRMNFDFDAVQERFWFADNGLITAVLSALSASFPPGEREFVRSVMHYRDEITDPVLREQMKGFAGQEGQHSHHHRRANAWLDELGFDASGIQKVVEENIAKFVPESRPEVHLATTVVLEHVTAILAEYMLTHEHIMASMSDTVRELFIWHGVEEIEHKAVAFDVYEAVCGDRNLLRRVGAITTLFFVVNQARHAAMALESVEHRPPLSEWLGAAKFFFGKDGLFTKIAKPYADFYRRDFHPWDNDNRHLIDGWKRSHDWTAD